MVVFTKATTGLACFLTLAAAIPMHHQHHGKRFSIEQVKHPHATSKGSKGGFAVQYANAMRKYGIEVPSHVQAAAEASQNSTNGPDTNGGGYGSVGTNPEEGEALYVTPVNVGGTTMNLDIDTGSADL